MLIIIYIINLMNILNKKYFNKIIDANPNIYYSYTTIDNLVVLHIYNPNNETFKLSQDNRNFYEKLANMYYSISDNSDNGCFNLEHKLVNDTPYLTIEDVLKSNLSNTYTFILIDIVNDITPLSMLGISENIMWGLCSNFIFRNKGYMTKLLLHVLKLIYNKKLKDKTLEINKLKLKIVSINPNKNKLIKYYNKFGFKINNDTLNESYLEMNLII